MKKLEDEGTTLSGDTSRSPRPAPECCGDWELESRKINAPIVLAQARNPYLSATPGFQFKAWVFCPWCGANRAEHCAEVKRFFELMSEIANSASSGDRGDPVESSLPHQPNNKQKEGK